MIYDHSLGAQTLPVVGNELQNYWLVNDQAGDGSGCYPQVSPHLCDPECAGEGRDLAEEFSVSLDERA